MSKTRARIWEKIADAHVIDTHEHTYPHEMIASKGPTIYDILEGGYVFWGTRAPRRDDDRSIVESLRGRSGSAFYKACSIAINDIYHIKIDPPSERALAEASERIQKAYRSGTWTRRIFVDRALIDTALLDPYWDILRGSFDLGLFRPVFRINMLLFGYNREAKDHNGNSPYILEPHLGSKVATFDDYIDLVDKSIEDARRRGYVALKSALAYDRSILFEETRESDAKEVFGRASSSLGSRDVKRFGDYVMHHILAKAGEQDLPVQFHTGLALIEGSDPMNLVNLLRKFPNVAFVFFHGGYPWVTEMEALAVTFPNLYLDLCWLPIISPSTCKKMLREAIELGLARKITWGGDCWVAEASYGALKVFKGILSDVLCEMVEDDYLASHEASDIASWILRDNAIKIYTNLMRG